jgi:hypothetical protein
MRRQAVHEKCRPAGLTQHLFVDLIGLEDAPPYFEFLFLTHACPGVRVNRVGSGNILGIRGPVNLLAGRWTVLSGTNRAKGQTDQAAGF